MHAPFFFRSKWTEVYGNVRNPINVYGVPFVSVYIRMQTERKLRSVAFSCPCTEQLTELAVASLKYKMIPSGNPSDRNLRRILQNTL